MTTHWIRGELCAVSSGLAEEQAASVSGEGWPEPIVSELDS